MHETSGALPTRTCALTTHTHLGTDDTHLGTHDTHLCTDAALELELELLEVGLGLVDDLVELGDFLAHLVDGEVDGTQVLRVVVDDRDALLDVRERVARCTSRQQRRAL